MKFHRHDNCSHPSPMIYDTQFQYQPSVACCFSRSRPLITCETWVARPGLCCTRSSNNGVDSAKSPATKQHKSSTNNIIQKAMDIKTLKFGAVDGAFDIHCLR